LKKIDIVIPVFKAKETIVRTLGSILIQSLVKECKVTLVNDYDGLDYSSIINTFSPYFEIVEIRLDKNCGAGVARQVGIDNSNLTYFTCIDADDSFSSTFALEFLLNKMEKEENAVLVAGSFLQEDKDLHFVQCNNDLVFMFGKLYKRSFIEKYQIQFNNTRANEDTGFNTMVRLCANSNEKIFFIKDAVYYWHMREDSITRINNYEFTYNQSFTGYVANMIYAINHVRKVNPLNSYINTWIIEVYAKLYLYLMRTKINDDRFTEQNFNSCVKYYNEIYKDVAEIFVVESRNEIIAKIIMERALEMKNVIPFLTVEEFTNKLKEGKL